MSYTHREVELLQWFAKRAEVERISELLKGEKKHIKEQITRIQKLVDEKK
jgi:hypothetical protein